MGSSFQNDDDMISGINVTPLVDVVLVLLVIFLITAPVMYQSAIKVKLPSASTGEESNKTPMEFTVGKDGKISWGTEQLDLPALEAKLKSQGKQFESETALINADKDTSHGSVVSLMDLLRRVGLSKFALSVESQ